MILSDAISLNTSVNIAGRISLHLPGLWECSIFEVVCWKKTVRREEKKKGEEWLLQYYSHDEYIMYSL